MVQGDLFDRNEGERLKKEKMKAAATFRAALLLSVRSAVKAQARLYPDRLAWADMGARWLVKNGYKATALGNAMGSLFKDGNWEWTGRWRKSDRTTNHRHEQRVWRLKNEMEEENS